MPNAWLQNCKKKKVCEHKGKRKERNIDGICERGQNLCYEFRTPE